ncbi:MAG: patatin-like protein [Sphingomonadales bacterium]|jgi:patatin-related protein
MAFRPVKKTVAKKTNAVPERELRLALVCYGGVSLAVYMHGVTKEILKLIRASRSLHAHSDPVRRAAAGYAQGEGASHRELDSEYIYFDLLQDIGQFVNLRVVVDIVAGASAGGINGIMLARALAHDLSLDAQRNMWLNLADVTELLDPEGRAGIWSKPFMRPLLSLVSWWQMRGDFGKVGGAAREPEVRKKLSLFTRSRWFEPPFSGRRMTTMMLDGLHSLGDPGLPGNSLMPPGHALELFVTTTDFRGHRQMITLHDPPMIQEREHRQILHFEFKQTPGGALYSDFDRACVPGLAFAARATSCFPGAFPPLNISEVDQLLKERGETWESRQAFLNHNFAAMRIANQNPEDAAFIDGSVLMNKPFALAIKSIQGRAAHREVDRRLVYIDPSPNHGDKPLEEIAEELPGFFSTLRGALSDIPRNQPIRDDLEWLETFNERVKRLSQVVEAIHPKVVEEIALILSKSVKRPPNPQKIASLRVRANELAAKQASYAYDGYARLKVLSVLRDVGDYLCALTKCPDTIAVGALVEAWAHRQDVRPIGDAAVESQKGGDASWIEFLRHFDVRFRVRRLRFILRQLNAQYRTLPKDKSIRTHAWLNEFKARIYDHLEAYQKASNWSMNAALSRFQASVEGMPEKHLSDDLVDEILNMAEGAMNLGHIDEMVEESLAYYATTAPHFDMWHEVITAYLGFPYYDVLTLPMVQWGDLDELDDIKVDRISVNDANTLRKGGARELLKGTELANFGAFFSRRYRENDYLWGRLTGAERLIDIVVSAAPEINGSMIDVRSYKKRIFKAILDAEAPYLKKVSSLISELLVDVKNL